MCPKQSVICDNSYDFFEHKLRNTKKNNILNIITCKSLV